MREIEVKAQVDSFDTVLNMLTTFGCKFSEPIVQEDTIFIPKGHTIPVDIGVNVFRIRKQNSKYICTLKQSVTNQLDCIEKEVEIDNPDNMRDIFELLGFIHFSSVNKKRIKTTYNGMEISLDEVESLGKFIEVEKMTTEEDGKKVQQELFDFLSSIGVDKEKQVYDGYDVMIAKAKNTTH